MTWKAVTAVLTMLAAASPAHGQDFPSRPVRMIVPFPAGGGADIIARIYSQKLAELWGQQVIIDNRGGAAGNIGSEIAAKAPPDGYTLYLGTMGTLTVNPSLYARLPFNVGRDFAPLTQLVAVHFVLVVHPSLPVRTTKELIALAKTRPGQINFSSSGAGGAPHLAGELFKRLANVDIVHIPYKGSGPSFADLLGGHVSLTFDSIVQSLPYIRDNRLRALAVLGTSRSPLLADVPTMAESGVSGYELTNWFGLAVPVSTPKNIINRLHADIAGVSQTPDLRQKLLGMGAEPIVSAPEAFAVLIQAESLKWARIIKEAGIKAE